MKDLVHVEKGVWSYERRTKKEEVKMRKQKDQKTLLTMLQEYQARKNALDSLVQQANQSVEIKAI